MLNTISNDVEEESKGKEEEFDKVDLEVGYVED